MKQALLGMGEACEKGDAESCSIVADLYLVGNDVPKDEVVEANLRARSLELHGKACERGDASACAAFGTGLSIKKQYAEAVRVFTIGCAAGDAGSCQLLAGHYDEGAGVAADPNKAKELFSKACEAGLRASCRRAAK